MAKKSKVAPVADEAPEPEDEAPEVETPTPSRKRKSSNNGNQLASLDDETKADVVQVMKLLSDPTRITIFQSVDGNKSVGELCQELDMTQPATSHHLALLKVGGLITPTRNGKNNYYSLSRKGNAIADAVNQMVAAISDN